MTSTGLTQVTLTKKEIKTIIRALSKLQLENFDIMDTTDIDCPLYDMLQTDNANIRALKAMLKQAIE